METTIQKRQKRAKRQEKQSAKAKLRRHKTIAQVAQEHNGKATADANTRAKNVTDAGGHDLENPT
jgi:hypothetical protein